MTKGIIFLTLGVVIFVVFLPWYKKNQTHQNTTNKTSLNKADILVQKLETQMQKNPKDIRTTILLSNAYIQKVRETADVSYYGKIDTLLNAAQKIDPNNPEIYAVQAMVDYGRHDFISGLAHGKKAFSLEREKAAYFALLGDAQIELGQYEEAVSNFQKMIDKRPDYNSYTRIAYIRELYGDIEGAIEAHKTAINSGSPYPENIAWSYVELGKLFMRSNLDEASNAFAQALTIYKDYPAALEGMGKIAFAKKDYKTTLTFFEKAFAILPIAAFAIDLGDLYTITGESTKASQHYTLAKIAFEKSQNSGVNTDLEMSLFLADHNLDLDTALTKARSAYRLRPSIYGADTLAWALYKKGDFQEAEKYIILALRLGEHDPLILFHAGMIAKENKNTEEAKRLIEKALSLHPYFSLLYINVASETIKKL